MTNSKHKMCRRLGIKLCTSVKCPIVKRPYPPGQKGKRRTRALSEYGKELREKQKLRTWYNLQEKQFKKYAKDILSLKQRKEDAATLFIRKLENRLDNVVFRLGFASSRRQARQLISHGHIKVNGKIIDIASFEARKGDIVEVDQKSKSKNIFKDVLIVLKKHQPPSWLKLDAEAFKGEVMGQASLEEAAPPAEISLIFEFYSK
ncbi:MAG: 30S ribosomal protein S4 [Candidatus Wildermuthbacteria bacterium RIFCSPHIGHO2_12_FULL_40_12]|uniref:Small ribosomal subunit protein uS4 n=1 Tax=Candidatus Wildermuthbacteria bacterium RIFCSPHIGHO2_12_FULL_40_12 TaxID=1802457 RepID=A0A1G2RFJ5_9BACT|nr:MAG: 30S ribosomal protein S4 [Candidatus Wildermuthbacteria bacterium RIFCSPHIGHO2_12_FULL_40_12]